MNWFIVDEIIKNAFKEDMHYEDITTEYLIEKNQISEALLLAKEEGIIAGLAVFKRVFFLLDPKIEVDFRFKDGEKVNNKDVIGKIKGSTVSILKGERIALNLLQRMSGISTETFNIVEMVKGYNVRIADTRKTTPNLRILEKYAVKIGGGMNHRYNLSEAVMIKDNHIKAAGGIKKAINKIRNHISHTMKIEVEVEDLEQLQEALEANPDIIMLDNMSCEMMKKAVNIANGQCIIEASGNMTKERIIEVAKTKVDIISIGALTHTVRALDISLRIQ